MAVVGDEQVGVAVVIVISDADALRPAVARQSGLLRHLGEMAVTVIAV